MSNNNKKQVRNATPHNVHIGTRCFRKNTERTGAGCGRS